MTRDEEAIQRSLQTGDRVPITTEGVNELAEILGVPRRNRTDEELWQACLRAARTQMGQR